MNSEKSNNRRLDSDCRQYKAKLNEYVDGTLSSDLTWRIKNHLVVCSSCAELTASLDSVARLLSGSARHVVSDSFESTLQARISALPQRQTFWNRARLFFGSKQYGLRQPLPVRLSAPFGALAACLAFALLFAHSAVVTTTQIGVQRTAASTQSAEVNDPTVIQACLNQHRADMTSDPLSDPSAQMLTASVDNIPVTPSDNHKLSDADASVLLGEEM